MFLATLAAPNKQSPNTNTKHPGPCFVIKNIKTTRNTHIHIYIQIHTFLYKHTCIPQWHYTHTQAHTQCIHRCINTLLWTEDASVILCLSLLVKLSIFYKGIYIYIYTWLDITLFLPVLCIYIYIYTHILPSGITSRNKPVGTGLLIVPHVCACTCVRVCVCTGHMWWDYGSFFVPVLNLNRNRGGRGGVRGGGLCFLVCCVFCSGKKQPDLLYITKTGI